MPLIPNKPVPALDLNLAGGGRFALAGEKPQHFKEIRQSLDFVIPKNYPARRDA